MNLRPKTKRRLLTLLIITLAGAGILTAVVILQLHRYENHRLAYRAAAMTAYQKRDYRTAADNFAKYLGNDRIDPEAIFDYAVTRSKLPRADLSNLTEARSLFNRYLEVRPGDVEAQHDLLEIYQKLGYGTEIAALSDQLLSTNAEDVPGLKARLPLLIREHHDDAALAVSEHLNELIPVDIPLQDTTYQLMYRLHKPASDLIDRAEGMLKKYPQDPRFELLRAVAAYWAGDRKDTVTWLNKAAKRTPPDADFVLLLAGAFDRMQMWAESRALLEKNATAPTASASLRANFVQRLWEMDQYDQALSVLHGINAADAATDSNLLGLQALVLLCKDGNDHPGKEFAADFRVLQSRSEDVVATSWSSLLSAIAGDDPKQPLVAVKLCQNARRADANNPDVFFYLGRAYLQLGETELGLQYLRQCTQMQPEWSAPFTLIARTLLGRDQAGEAVENAQAAVQRDPGSSVAQKLLAMATARRLPPSATAADIQPVLSFIHELRTTMTDDPVLLADEVDLLARSGHKEAAIAIAQEALTTSSASSPQALKELAVIDQRDHLEIAAQIFDRLKQCQPTIPLAAMDQVQGEIATGNKSAAVALLPAIAAHASTDWRLAWLQAREAVADTTGLTEEWAKLSDAHPRDLSVQQAAIHSAAANSDRALVDRTIERLKALTGEDAIEPKLARARWQLGSNDDAKTSANAAAASMAEVVNAVPEYAPPQAIWADALDKLGDVTGAIAHLKLAVQIEPANAGLGLKLARLYESQGRFGEMAGALNQTTAIAWLTPQQRIASALLYRSMDDRASAIRLLDEEHAIHLDDPIRDVVLCQLYQEIGDEAAAKSLLDKWLMAKTRPVEIIKAIADFQAQQSSLTDARKSLAELDAMELPPGERDRIVGEFESRWGDKATAAALFANATQAAPANSAGWQDWAAINLRERDFSGAFTVAGQGLLSNPKDIDLAALKDLAQELAGASLNDDVQPLIDQLCVDPTSEAGAATVKAITESETTADQRSRLSAVAEKYPRYLPVLLILIEHDFRSGDYKPAAELAARACVEFPIEPEPARWLTRIYSTSAQYEKAAAAAEEWHGRSLRSPHTADLAIAATQLALHHPEVAISQLQWCSTKSPVNDTDAHATELIASALCMEGKFDEAWQIIDPLAAQSSVWRDRWLRMATENATDSETAKMQISRIETMPGIDSESDRLAIATACYGLGARFNMPDFLQKAKSLVEPQTARSAPTLGALLLLSAIDRDSADLVNARSLLLKAVGSYPDFAEAKNNLAMVMLLGNEDAESARELARQAADKSPTTSAFHSTLGEALQRLKDYPAAKREFERAVELNTMNAEAVIGLAFTQHQQGDESSAQLSFSEAENILNASPQHLPVFVEQELQGLRQPTTRAAVIRQQ